MPRSQKEIDDIISAIQRAFEKAYKAEDYDTLAKFYHPHAVFVMKAHWCIYGRDKIKEKLIEYGPSNLKTTFDSNVETSDGDYIVHKGRFSVGSEPKKFSYQQIFRRDPDGSYLIYHDEVSA